MGFFRRHVLPLFLETLLFLSYLTGFILVFTYTYTHWLQLFSLPRIFFASICAFIFVLGFFHRELMEQLKRLVKLLERNSM